VAIAVGGAGMEVNKLIRTPDYDIVFGAIVVAIFAIVGCLLLASGHKLHKQSVELESIRKELN